MNGNFQVQKAGLNSSEWKTVFRNEKESEARTIYKRQLELYSIGKFRLLDPEGKVLESDTAKPLFSNSI